MLGYRSRKGNRTKTPRCVDTAWPRLSCGVVRFGPRRNGTRAESGAQKRRSNTPFDRLSIASFQDPCTTADSPAQPRPSTHPHRRTHRAAPIRGTQCRCPVRLAPSSGSKMWPRCPSQDAWEDIVGVGPGRGYSGTVRKLEMSKMTCLIPRHDPSGTAIYAAPSGWFQGSMYRHIWPTWSVWDRII